MGLSIGWIGEWVDHVIVGFRFPPVKQGENEQI
jgi:hypothetical protein